MSGSTQTSLAGAPAGLSDLDQIERSIAEAVGNLRPGRRNTKGAHSTLTDMRRQLASAAWLDAAPTDTLVDQLPASDAIDDALKKTTQAHLEALSKEGVDRRVLNAIQSLLDVTFDARVLQMQLELERARSRRAQLENEIATLRENLTHLPAAPADDPAQPLSAVQLGKRLGELSDETVRQRERKGELFSILRAGRKRGREYPAFQAWPGIAGLPLAAVLAALGYPASLNGAAAYGFFTSPTELLGGLSPVETLVGQLTAPRALDADAQALLTAPAAERQATVVTAAEAHAAMLSA